MTPLARLLLVIASCSIALRAADAPKPDLIPELKPLQKMLGTWKGVDRRSDGEKVDLILRVKPTVNGHGMVLEIEAKGSDWGPEIVGLQLYYWDSSAKVIANTSVHQIFGNGRAILVPTEEGIVSHGQGMDLQGKHTIGVGRTQFVGENTMRYRAEVAYVNGEKQLPVEIEFTRVKD